MTTCRERPSRKLSKHLWLPSTMREGVKGPLYCRYPTANRVRYPTRTLQPLSPEMHLREVDTLFGGTFSYSLRLGRRGCTIVHLWERRKTRPKKRRHSPAK